MLIDCICSNSNASANYSLLNSSIKWKHKGKELFDRKGDGIYKSNFMDNGENTRTWDLMKDKLIIAQGTDYE